MGNFFSAFPSGGISNFGELQELMSTCGREESRK